MPPALAVIAVLAAAVAAVFLVAWVRARRTMLAQRAALRGALDVAGVGTLEDLIASFDAARRRNDAVLALAPAVDEMVEKQARLLAALRDRDSQGASAQHAMKSAADEVAVASDAAGRLAHDVGVAGAAVEQTVASISTVSSNIGGLADNVASVSSAIGELAVSVNQVAGNAQEASSRSVLADTKARDGGVAVERLVRSTREIADDINAVVAKMQELGAASERIGAIVEVIDAIADQTNLLALNAAIEAARAGEHGRGFAVVADEVRKLAESSARSTREIGQLVKDIQAKTAEVVRSTTASGQKAENGLEMADLAGRAIGDISAAVAEANRLIEQISMAAHEQAGGSSAIVNSVEQMDRLMREAAQSLDEQNSSNRQIINIIADIQGHARGVEEASERQRSAFDALVRESIALAAASAATREAVAAIDGVGEALRERVHGIAGTALAVQGASATGAYVSRSA